MRDNLITLIPPVLLGLIFGLVWGDGLATFIGILIGCPIGIGYLWWELRRG